MRRIVLTLATLIVAFPLCAQTADEIVSKYIKTVGGLEKIDAVKTLRRSGKFDGGGGFTAAVVEEKKRPNLVRQEFSFQGLTSITAYDGRSGWKVRPFGGKKDPEPLGEEEMKSILDDSDFDGPLVNYQQKGNKVEYVGMEPVEGTDAYKLRVTLKTGDIEYYYMDTDYYVPIKIETKRFVRGEEREFETSLGDYKQVNGWYMPYSFESGPKGSQDHNKITIEKIEPNVDIAESRFHEPVAAAKQPTAAPDASMQPKPEQKNKPAPATAPKPPREER